MEKFDFLIIGAGIVGLATALRLQEKKPGATVVVVEKESHVAAHQSGHNSGVIHAGVYYEPGSLKARFCRAGLVQTMAFCQHRGVPFKQCGKLVIATTQAEVPRLAKLSARAHLNGVDCHSLSMAELKQIEPNVVGLGALHVTETGIVDYAAMCRVMADLVTAQGGVIKLASAVVAIREGANEVEIETATSTLCAKHLIACAGLHSDRLASLAGLEIDFAIIPFRGDFYRLAAHRADIVDHLIYPVADPSLPFLGVHLTATTDGGMTVGPSAMLSLHREGYAKLALSVQDLSQMMRFPGLWRLLARNTRAGVIECAHTISKQLYLRAIRRYCPSLEIADLVSQHSGIRAQAVTRDGLLVQDFLVKRTKRMTHICNAPSPAATAAFPIAQFIVDELHV